MGLNRDVDVRLITARQLKVVLESLDVLCHATETSLSFSLSIFQVDNHLFYVFNLFFFVNTVEDARLLINRPRNRIWKESSFVKL